MEAIIIPGCGQFWLGWQGLCRGTLGIATCIYTKYISHGPHGLRENIFKVCQLLIPGRYGQFEAQEFGCYDLCRVPLDIAIFSKTLLNHHHREKGILAVVWQ